MEFFQKLKYMRESKKLTQIELGKKLNISNRVIAYYEADQRFPKDQETLVKIADFFDVSVDWLLGRTEMKNFTKDDSDVIYLDSEGLSQADIDKINEYSALLKSKNCATPQFRST